jgi:hypothetical protein
MSAHTALSVAQWMASEVNSKPELYQDDAVSEIEKTFGKSFLHENTNGNLAINPDVLKEFEQLTKTSVVWAKSGRYWRLRQAGDEPGRQQRY